MKRLTLKLCLILLVSANSYAQAPPYQWVNQQGGTANEIGRAITIDNTNHLYEAGEFEGIVNFGTADDPIFQTSVGERDVFIQKLDREQNQIWIKSIGGIGVDRVYDAASDSEGHFWCTGSFEGTVDFDPGPDEENRTSIADSKDVFVLELDGDGNFINVIVIGGTADDESESIIIDNSDNVYIAGYYQTTVDFNPSADVAEHTAIGGKDIFMLKLNSAGEYIWAKTIGSTTNDQARDIALDNSNNLYITGSFSGIADFDPGPGVNTVTAISNNIFGLKLDAAGDFEWVSNLGGGFPDHGYSIVADSDHFVYLAGRATLPAFDGSFLTGAWVFRLTETGSLDWARHHKEGERPRLALDDNEDLYMTGKFTGTTDFDWIEPGLPPSFELTSFGSGDIFIKKMDTEIGAMIWAEQFGGTNDDYGSDILIFENEEVYVTGGFHVTGHFDPESADGDITSLGNYDAFLVKLSCRNTGEIETTVCDEYISPSGLYNYTSTGIYKDTLSNINGCDSVITIDLTVNYFSISTEDVAACESYIWAHNGLEYTTSDLLTDTLTSVLTGCDSIIQVNLEIASIDSSITVDGLTISAVTDDLDYQWINCETLLPIDGATGQSFEAIMDGEYAVIMTDGICTDTSECAEIIGVGIQSEKFNFIKIYPNPTNSNVFIETTDAKRIKSIELIDATGQIVGVKIINSSQAQLACSSYNPGLYILKLTMADNSVEFKKLMISL